MSIGVILLVIFIAYVLIRAFGKYILIGLGIALVIAAILNPGISLPIIGGIAAITGFIVFVKFIYHSIKVIKWKKAPAAETTEIEYLKWLRENVKAIYSKDSNDRGSYEDIPFGRVNYFLSFFKKSIADEEPVYFSPVRSKALSEMREYGFLITTSGIYVSFQKDKNESDDGKKKKKRKVERNKNTDDLTVSNYFIPFSGLYGFSYNNDLGYMKIINVNFTQCKSLPTENMTLNADALKEFLSAFIESGFPKSLYEKKVFAFSDKTPADNSKRYKSFFKKDIGMIAAGVAETMFHTAGKFSEVGYSMGKARANGGAAEYANNTIEKIFHKDAQQIGGNNAKNGADRIYSEGGETVNIQCKYNSDAYRTLRDAFYSHDYPTDMKIEVPRDQYAECLSRLQDDIDAGKLENKGILPGDRAEKYLLKGKITYNQSLNIARSGSVEGLLIDSAAGISCASGAAGITSLITFAVSKWYGMSTKDAALVSLKTGASVMGRGTAVYVLSMQLGSRSEFINYFSHHTGRNGSIVYDSKINPFYKLGESVSEKIKTGSLASTEMGKKLGLNSIKGQSIISGGIMLAVSFGPDLWRASTGKISGKQLAKNSAVTGGGITGAILGQALIPIPVVGSAVGGYIGSKLTKSLLDGFIEDDRITMYNILKEEFIEGISLAGLTSEEMKNVFENSIGSENLEKILKNMYASGSPRNYVRKNLINASIEKEYRNRELITQDMYSEGYLQLIA